MIVCSTKFVPLEWRIDGSAWAVILPLSMSAACHILFPVCFILDFLQFFYFHFAKLNPFANLIPCIF